MSTKKKRRRAREWWISLYLDNTGVALNAEKKAYTAHALFTGSVEVVHVREVLKRGRGKK